MLRFFNEQNIKSAKVETAPAGFKYGYVDGVFKNDVYDKLAEYFPDVAGFKFIDKANSGGGRKMFYVGPVYYSGKHRGCVCHLSGLDRLWREVMLEAASSEFVGLLQSVARVKFNSVCDFGFAYGKEGCVQEPHIDGSARPDDKSPVRSTLACLLYFNKEAGGSSGTCIYASDRQTKLFQVPSLRNTMSFFEQHISAWHGFPPVPAGENRKILSLSYSHENKPINIKTSFGHRLICPLLRFQNKGRQFIISRLK